MKRINVAFIILSSIIACGFGCSNLKAVKGMPSGLQSAGIDENGRLPLHRLILGRIDLTAHTQPAVMPSQEEDEAHVRIHENQLWNVIRILNTDIENVNARDSIGQTILHLAVSRGDDYLPLVKAIVERVRDINLNIRDYTGSTALDIAVQLHSWPIYRYLRQAMHLPQQTRAEFEEICAERAEHKAAAAPIIASPALPVPLIQVECGTPVPMPIAFSSPERSVRKLLVRPDRRNKMPDDEVPFADPSIRQKFEKLLKNIRGNLPELLMAGTTAMFAWKSILILLHHFGRTPASKKNIDAQLLDEAATGHNDKVTALLAKGAKIETRDANGNTAFMSACANGHVATAKILLKSGAHIDAQNNKGQTALMLAALNGHQSIVEVLINAGADIELQDSDGHKVIRLLLKNRHKDMAKFLMNTKAKKLGFKSAVTDIVYNNDIAKIIYGDDYSIFIKPNE